MFILNGASYSDTEFFQLQKEIERKWNKPIALAIAFHVIVFGLSVILPNLDRKPLLDEIVTVNLVSLPEMNEPAPESAPPEKQVEKPPEIQKVEPEKPKVRIAEVPEAVPEKVKPAKPISVKPLKRKVKKSDPEKLAREKARKQRELERQQALAEAKLEEERARLEAEAARAALAAMIRQKGVQNQSPRQKNKSGGREIKSIVVRNYLAAIHGQVQQYWVLPGMKQWDTRLETIVALYINRNGTVKTVIEKKSKDPFYDQFVMKTLNRALPLPPLPKMITEVPLEVVLIFKPGELLSM